MSLLPTGEGDLNDIGRNISVDESLFIEIVAECGQNRVSAKLEPLFKAKEIKNQKISNEFVGELFYTENPANKTILLLGGSGGALGGNLPMAAVLASHGFNVLTVAYFHEKGLPEQLAQIPLEYFEKVFAWLSNNPVTRGQKLYVHATSKGAELALLLASRYPVITRVAAFAPHAYCFQGLNFKNVSSWTYQGKDLPYIRLKNSVAFTSMIGALIQNKAFGFTYTYKKGLAAAKNKDAARIQIENARADLLLFAGKQCGMWNTYGGCVQIMDTLRQRHYPHQYDLEVYEEAGEPYPLPYVIPPGQSTSRMAPRLVLSMGGTLRGNAHAQADSWQKAIEFFKRDANAE